MSLFVYTVKLCWFNGNCFHMDKMNLVINVYNFVLYAIVLSIKLILSRLGMRPMWSHSGKDGRINEATSERNARMATGHVSHRGGRVAHLGGQGH